MRSKQLLSFRSSSLLYITIVLSYYKFWIPNTSNESHNFPQKILYFVYILVRTSDKCNISLLAKSHLNISELVKCTNAIHRPGYFTLQLLHLSVIKNILYKEVLCTGLFHLCIIMIMWNLGTESNKGCFMRNSDFVIEIWRSRKSRHCTWSLVYCFPLGQWSQI